MGVVEYLSAGYLCSTALFRVQVGKRSTLGPCAPGPRERGSIEHDMREKALPVKALRLSRDLGNVTEVPDVPVRVKATSLRGYSSVVEEVLSPLFLGDLTLPNHLFSSCHISA